MQEVDQHLFISTQLKLRMAHSHTCRSIALATHSSTTSLRPASASTLAPSFASTSTTASASTSASTLTSAAAPILASAQTSSSDVCVIPYRQDHSLA